MRPPPDFVMLGAQKAGTTALHAALAQHPGACLSRPKELRFFLGDGAAPAFAGPGAEDFLREGRWTEADYAAGFAGAPVGALRGEATPAYLSAYDPAGVARRIAARNPQARLIAVLRDPAERAFSAFLHHRRLGYEPLSDFGAALAAEEERIQAGWLPGWGYRRNGCYATLLAPFFEGFPREQIHVVTWEEWNAQPAETFAGVCRFLGLETKFRPDFSARHNVTRLPRFRALARWRGAPLWLRRLNSHRPEIPGDLRRELLAGYRAEIARVEALTGLPVVRLWR